MTKPIILVTSDLKFFENYYWHAAPDTYLRALVDGADVVPLVLPCLSPSPEEMDSILDRIDGVLATGSKSNVNPELYGEEATEDNGPYDPARDATTLPLLRRAIERAIPVFAICRGMQELNVSCGGSLLTEIQDLEGIGDHRAPNADHQDERFRIAHPIDVEKNSQLANVVGDKPIEVNSLHRQAVGRLGNGIKVEARAEDGTIEAISVEGATGYLVATQWHPEYWVKTDVPSRQLFKAFGDAARNYAASKS
ncbi:MAG: gamma-glutamyl-gamma-aminobutyrate hydrolase family protein [Rhodobacteraceae bacterium]|nr:gamma-glutamyl-gamma-aminobutyrate hydrolase family protein [Paracoccaceae bacterium]